jgi:exonuclease SbcC
MRPERLTLKSFGAFRNDTQIDFSAVELFAITGPTGSGKTTILDGICFALYGSVPRYGRGAVAPVVSQGLMEATVGLTFSIGEQMYQVARRVKRDAKKKAAGIVEASLELVGSDRSVEVLAMGGQVTDRVIDLLGLDVEQFTTCVLLPQGEFARFLHDKPANRQDLLTALLDLGIYDRVGQLALTRQRTAEGLLGMLDQRLAELGTVTDEDLAAARDQESRLVQLLRWVEETLPELQALENEARDLKSEVDRYEVMLMALRAVEMPVGIDVLGVEVASLQSEEVLTQEALEAARSRSSDLVELSATLPSRSQMQTWVEARKSLTATTAGLAPATSDASAAELAWKEAAAALASARDVVKLVADADRAAHLRRGLKVGDTCPICGQPITELAKAHGIGTVKKAEAALSKSEKDEQKLRTSHHESENLVRRLRDRIADLTHQLEGVPDSDELIALAKRVEVHETALVSTAAELAAGKRRLDQIQERRRKTVEREAAIKSGLRTAWSKVAQAGLELPEFEQDDPFRSWRELEEWRIDTEPRVLESASKALALVEELGHRRNLATDAIAARLDGMGIRAGGRSPRDAVVDTLTAARADRERIEAALAESVAKVAQREVTARDQMVARQLSLELRANRFKEWLFDEVFAALIAGANLRLGDLTRGQYELVIAGRDFEVIDNLAAGNRRSVKSLSGGETFLVSLALALALADQVAESAIGEARLDSFFLDEGFGSLDAESLEVVAGIITDLGASGKTVGIVTHVAELAEQMPVRYEVRKSANGAMVTEMRQ